MSEPTKRPWEVGGPYPRVSVIKVVSYGSASPVEPEPPTSERLCAMDDSGDGTRSEQALADAELIVRAVNSHDALVAAVQAALTREAEDEFGNGIAEAYATPAYLAYRKQLREAYATPGYRAYRKQLRDALALAGALPSGALEAIGAKP